MSTKPVLRLGLSLIGAFFLLISIVLPNRTMDRMLKEEPQPVIIRAESVNVQPTTTEKDVFRLKINMGGKER